MPIGAAATYPAVSDVMALARSLVNDTLKGATGTAGEGQILTNNAPFTGPFLNSAIRWLSRKLGNSSVTTLIKDNVVITNLAPVVTPDPALQVSLTYLGYNNGTTLDTTRVLEADCLAVLEMWERASNTSDVFQPMLPSQFGLPGRLQYSYFRDWEYRQDGIYMVGATQARDIRMRLSIALPANITGNGSDFANISIPILDCADAIACKLAALYTSAREETTEAFTYLNAEAESVAEDLVNRQVRAKQATEYHRQPYGGNFSWRP